MKFLKLLIVIALILFPLGEILRFDIGNNIVIKPLDVIVGLTAFWWVVLQFQRSKFKTENFNSKLKTFLILFIGVGFLSLLLNLTWLKPHEFFVSLLYLIRWISYALIFFVIFQSDEKFKQRIKHLLFIDGFIILAAGYVQYFFYNSLRNLYYLGWDEHKHRMFSVFFDPNFLGAFLVLYLIFIGAKLFSKNKLKTNYRIFLYITSLLTLIAIFLTFSRSAILMLIVSSVVFLFLINKKKLIFALLGVTLLFGLISSPKFYDENMNLFREASSKARIVNFSIAWNIFQDHPIVGVGFNSYRYTKDLYGLDHNWINVQSHSDSGTDNSFIFVLATTGIIGGIGYFGMWFVILKYAFARYKKNIIATVLIASVVGLFVNSLFINSLFFAPFMLWVWILVGLVEYN